MRVQFDSSSPMRRRAFLTSLGCSALARTLLAIPPPPPPSPELLRLAGRCVLAGWRGPQIPPGLAARITDGALGGVLLARENLAGPGSLVRLTAACQRLVPAGGAPLLVAADQEGGPVSHLSPPLPPMPSMLTLGTLDDVALTERVAVALGHGLRGAGVNFNLAPVLDVRTNRANTVILGRAFGSDPALVARHGVAFVAGLTAAGVLSCAKHFPGHGDTREDSHAALPRVVHGVERLAAVELVPFAAVASTVPAVMMAHVVYSGVEPGMPASLSRPHAVGLLRERLGFQGVAVTDDLEMSAIRSRWGVAQGALRAMRAGCDLLTVAHTVGAAGEVVRLLAQTAAGDEDFRRRLEEAAARVDAMRRRLAGEGMPVRMQREPVGALLREVQGRAARGRGPRGAMRDPTRPR